MKLEIPLQPHPNQIVEITLESQYCKIELKQREPDQLYFNLTVNNQKICDSVLCNDRVPLIKTDHRGFIGCIYFEDLKGVLNPTYDGFGTRYRLIYGDLPEDPLITEPTIKDSFLVTDNGFYITQDNGGLIIL